MDYPLLKVYNRPVFVKTPFQSKIDVAIFYKV